MTRSNSWSCECGSICPKDHAFCSSCTRDRSTDQEKGEEEVVPLEELSSEEEATKSTKKATKKNAEQSTAKKGKRKREKEEVEVEDDEEESAPPPKKKTRWGRTAYSYDEKVRFYIFATDNGLDVEETEEEKKKAQDAKWNQFYFQEEGEHYTGAPSNNKYYRRWWNNEKNRIDPRTEGNEHAKHLEMLRQAVEKLRKITGDKNAKLVVPKYQSSQDMWWYNLLDEPWQRLVRKISIDKNDAKQGNKAPQQRLEDYEEAGVNLDNESAYDDHLVGNVRNVKSNKNRHHHALGLLFAAGVPLENIPQKYRPYMTIKEFAEYISEKYEECEFKGYLNAIEEIQREMFSIVSDNMDLLEDYWKRNGNVEYKVFKQWLVEIGLGCHCESCQVSHAPICACDIQHLDRDVKQEHGMKQPSECTAKQLSEQLVARKPIISVQTECKNRHTEEDQSHLFNILSGKVENDGCYDANTLNRQQLMNAGVEAIHGTKSFLSGKKLSSIKHPSEHHHHLTGENNIEVVHEDGSTTIYQVAKVEDTSQLKTKRNSFEEFCEEARVEMYKIRRCEGWEHQILEMILANEELRYIFGITMPYTVDEAKKKIIIKEDFSTNLPPVQEEGITRDIMEKRLAEVLKDKQPLPDLTTLTNSICACGCSVCVSCQGGGRAKRIVDCIKCEQRYIASQVCFGDGDNWICQSCNGDEDGDATELAASGSISNTSSASTETGASSQPANSDMTYNSSLVIPMTGMRLRVLFNDPEGTSQTWYEGIISRLRQNEDGSYNLDVTYDDGDEFTEQYPNPGQIELLASRTNNNEAANVLSAASSSTTDNDETFTPQTASESNESTLSSSSSGDETLVEQPPPASSAAVSTKVSFDESSVGEPLRDDSSPSDTSFDEMDTSTESTALSQSQSVELDLTGVTYNSIVSSSDLAKSVTPSHTLSLVPTSCGKVEIYANDNSGPVGTLNKSAHHIIICNLGELINVTATFVSRTRFGFANIRVKYSTKAGVDSGTALKAVSELFSAKQQSASCTNLTNSIEYDNESTAI